MDQQPLSEASERVEGDATTRTGSVFASGLYTLASKCFDERLETQAETSR